MTAFTGQQNSNGFNAAIGVNSFIVSEAKTSVRGTVDIVSTKRQTPFIFLSLRPARKLALAGFDQEAV